eukprot:1160835-Pelagomonas_calceolata.AAC.2
MGRKPLGLPASGKVHTPGCPGPPSAPPTLEIWLPSRTKLLGSPAVSGGHGRQWLVLQFLARANQPTIRPGTQHAGPAKPFVGDSKFWWLPVRWAELQDTLLYSTAEKSWSVVPIQAPRTAPVDTNFQPNPRTSQSTCAPFQLAAEPTDLHDSNCDVMLNLCSNDGVSCCKDREVKAQTCADAMRSRQPLHWCIVEGAPGAWPAADCPRIACNLLI